MVGLANPDRVRSRKWTHQPKLPADNSIRSSQREAIGRRRLHAAFLARRQWQTRAHPEHLGRAFRVLVQTTGGATDPVPPETTAGAPAGHRLGTGFKPASSE